MEFVYPSPAGKIYVPVELDGSKGRAVFEVVHRDAGAELYWHLDGAFAGSTAAVHQLAVELPPGAHRVTVVDEAGNRLVRSFEILSRTAGDAAAPPPRSRNQAAPSPSPPSRHSGCQRGAARR